MADDDNVMNEFDALVVTKQDANSMLLAEPW